MANVLAELFQNTANAIREKTGESGTMKPAEFPDKIRGITVTEEANLVPLTVTENGTYYPQGNIELGNSYYFRNDYTQAELKALYDIATEKSDDGVYAHLVRLNGEAIGIMRYEESIYTVFISAGFVWIPPEFASTFGYAAGWHWGSDITDLTPIATPIAHFADEEMLIYTDSLSVLNPLFDLPEADGFSSVEVNVKGGGASIDGVEVYTLTFIGEDGSVLYTKPCTAGDTSYDPYEEGKIDLPTKESTAQHNYIFNGWSLTEGGEGNSSTIVNITEDRTLYAGFVETERFYTVRFWDGDTLLKEEQVAYGGTAEPPTDLIKEGYVLNGWIPNTFTVYEDTEYQADWEELKGWIIRETDPNFIADVPSAIAYSPAENRLAISEKGSTNKVSVYDTTSYPYTKLFSFEADLITTGDYVPNNLHYSDNGNYLACRSYEGHQVFDTTSTPYVKVNGSGGDTDALKFIPGTTNLVSGSTANYVRNITFDFATNFAFSTSTDLYNNHSISFDRTGTRVALADYNGWKSKNGIAVYSVETGEKDTACPENTTSMYYCAFDYSGRYLFAMGYSKIFIYDTSTNPYTTVYLKDIADVSHSVCSGSKLITSRNNELLFFQTTDKKLVAYDTRTFPFTYIEDFPEIAGSIADITVSSDLKEMVVICDGTPIFLKKI